MQTEIITVETKEMSKFYYLDELKKRQLLETLHNLKIKIEKKIPKICLKTDILRASKIL